MSQTQTLDTVAAPSYAGSPRRAGDVAPALTQAILVGQAIDVFGPFRLPDAIITNLLDPAKAPTHTITLATGQTYTVPIYVSLILGQAGRTIDSSSDTREDFQDSIALTANAAAEIGAFSGQMSVSYGSQYASSSDYSYAYRNTYADWATLEIALDEALKYRSGSFVDALSTLPAVFSPTQLDPFLDFFDRFGYYFTSMVYLGGVLEYSVAVSKGAQQGATQIAVHLNAEYNALLAAGSMSADTARESSWQAYVANRYVRINMLGGDPVCMSQVMALAETEATPAGPDAVGNWLASIQASPAATGFKVRGIWELAGPQRQALLDAFTWMKPGFRPKVTIESGIRAGRVPSIVLGQAIVPATPPEFPNGFQVVVVDRANLAPSGVVHSQYYSAPLGASGGDDYRAMGEMWQRMVRDIQASHYDTPNYLLILATFACPENAPPIQGAGFTAFSFLRSAGAGQRLVQWTINSEPGYRLAEIFGTYALVGILGLGAGVGVEVMHFSDDASPINLEVFFYRQPNSRLHSLSIGGGSATSSVRRERARW